MVVLRMAMIFNCTYEKLWTALCLFDLRFQSLCDCLWTEHPFGTSHLEDLTQKGCACSAHRQDKQDPLQESHAGVNNPVGINEAMVRTDAPISHVDLRAASITAMTMR